MLKQISLSFNKLQKLPTTLNSFANLRIFDLENNELKELPREISSLKNLVRLNLSHNQLQSLPKEIGELIFLKELLLDDNQLKYLPREMRNLIHLQSLSLENNNWIPETDESKKERIFYFNEFFIEKENSLKEIMSRFILENHLVDISSEIFPVDLKRFFKNSKTCDHCDKKYFTYFIQFISFGILLKCQKEQVPIVYCVCSKECFENKKNIPF